MPEKVTLYTPAELYTGFGVAKVEVPMPVPKFHKTLVAPAGPEKRTDKGAQPAVAEATICDWSFATKPKIRIKKKRLGFCKDILKK